MQGILCEKWITELSNKEAVLNSFIYILDKNVDLGKTGIMYIQLELNYYDFLPHFWIQKFR